MVNALVIDDNEVNTMILVNMLEQFLVRADFAYHGSQAVSMCRQKTYDIIFVDHMMPDMDGIQTTTAIRNQSPDCRKTVIIALTADITEQLRYRYLMVGANDLYQKPLSLSNLSSLLKNWFPDLKKKRLPINPKMSSSDHINDTIKTIIQNIPEIDYEKGLSYAIGNPVQFMNILETSQKDLQSCINIIDNNQKDNSATQLLMGVHKLKNVLSNIGAVRLTEKTDLLEKLLQQQDFSGVSSGYDSFRKELEQFRINLSDSLQNYNIQVQRIAKEQDLFLSPMQSSEYEQSLLNTIYYIRRYEYDSAVRELKRLILQGCPEWKQEFELAFKDVRDYNYEKALSRIMRIKNETGDLPIPEIKNTIQLKSFWD